MALFSRCSSPEQSLSFNQPGMDLPFLFVLTGGQGHEGEDPDQDTGQGQRTGRQEIGSHRRHQQQMEKLRQSV